MLEAMLSTGYLLFIFPKIIKLNILMEETICKSCILGFMNAKCTVCMILLLLSVRKHADPLFKHELMIFDCPFSL